jgi:Metallo-peptidase family M12B Reprolysin-like
VLGALVAICLNFTTTPVFAQSLNCSTPDIPLAQMEQILANLPNNPIVAGGSPIRIPIWFIQVRTSVGSTNLPGYQIESQMDELNQYFDGVFEFSVCGSSFVDNDDYYNLNLQTEASVLNGLVDSMYQPNINHCVKVFLVNYLDDGSNGGPSGFAHPRYQYNENAAVYSANGDINTIAHELGHYFGLPHTFMDAANQYVHDLAHPVLINGTLTTCYHTGDGFCDTPAEIEYFTCPPSIFLGVDPLGVPYTPDATLLMSYSSCRNRFSSEQKVRMLTLYNLDGNYAALKDIPADCVVKTGKIINHCIKPGNLFPAPFDDLKVIVKEFNQNCQDFTDAAGNYHFKPVINCNLGNDKRSILPDLDYSSPVNGVTTYDIVLLNKHVIGLEPLDSPFKIIAADANNSGSVTTFDGVIIRKVVLGILPNFPDSLSWRYIPKLYLGNQNFLNQFDTNDPFSAQIDDPFASWTRYYKCPPNPSNPNAPPQPIPNNCTWMDHVSVIPTHPLAQLQSTWSFIGVKVGDLNCTAKTDGLEQPPPSEAGFGSQTGFPISIGQGVFKKIQVIANTSQQVVAWQFGASFPATALNISSFGAGNTANTFDPENQFFINGTGSAMGISHLNALWVSPNGEALAINNKVLFEFVMQANAPISALENLLQINSATAPLKFYNASGQEIPVTLKLNATNMVGMKSGGSADRNSARFQVKNASACPNPFGGIVDFSFELLEDAAVKIMIFNIDGKLVAEKSENLLSGQQEVQLSGLNRCPPGIYSYSIGSEGTMYRGKLVKK